jgi:hypothetical protein
MDLGMVELHGATASEGIPALAASMVAVSTVAAVSTAVVAPTVAAGGKEE